MLISSEPVTRPILVLPDAPEQVVGRTHLKTSFRRLSEVDPSTSRLHRSGCLSSSCRARLGRPRTNATATGWMAGTSPHDAQGVQCRQDNKWQLPWHRGPHPLQQQAQRILDDLLKGPHPGGAQRPVGDAVIDRQRAGHHCGNRQFAVLVHDRPLAARRDR
jgi:hypothetical protein